MCQILDRYWSWLQSQHPEYVDRLSAGKKRSHEAPFF